MVSAQPDGEAITRAEDHAAAEKECKNLTEDIERNDDRELANLQMLLAA